MIAKKTATGKQRSFSMKKLLRGTLSEIGFQLQYNMSDIYIDLSYKSNNTVVLVPPKPLVTSLQLPIVD